MKLSENFTLEEMLESGTARRLKITEQFNPPESVQINLKALCDNILQPLRDHIGPIHVSSGYRCPRLNKAVGGAKTSQHLTGEAADIQGTGNVTNKMVYDAIVALNLPFDQLLNEYNYSWVHVSFGPRNRRQKLAIT